MRDLLKQFSKFVVVGLSSTIIDFGIVNLLFYVVNATLHLENHSAITLWFIICATISFMAATLNSFYWNRKWTFEASHRSIKETLPHFYLVTISSFLINVGLSSLIVGINPLPSLSRTLLINGAKVIATGVSLCTNFLGYRFVAFKKD